MKFEEKISWLFFSLVPAIGPKKFKLLEKYFKNLENAFKTSFSEFKRSGLDERTINNILKTKKEIDLEKILKELKKKKIEFITLREKDYPRLLKEIYAPPPVLFYQGKIKAEEYSLAVVGTRKTSNYGRQVVPQIVKPLAENKITIVSGLALGIDSLAHQATLQATGRTIAVLGAGLDKIYPQSNQKLADKIIDSGGLLLSEFPPATIPLKGNFPRRNRIISGLALGTLVIEAPEKSGALITAYYSLEQNREVFAVPGSIFSKNSAGTNKLIKLGAKAVTKAQDILEALNLKSSIRYLENKKIIPETKEEKIILKILTNESLHIDKIIEWSKLESSVVNSTLALMEIKGLVKNIGGMVYIKAR